MTTTIYRPDGAISHPAVTRAQPRRVLAGARIGVLDNLKPNAGLLMTTVAERLAQRGGAAQPLLVRTKNAAHPAPDEVLDEFKVQVHLAITGSAD